MRVHGLSDLSQQLEELVTVDPRSLDDLAERLLGQVPTVKRHHDAMPVFGMPENVVASLDTIEAPAAALQRANRLPRCHGRKPRRHAPTVTRSISIGPGIGSPWAASDSRYASIASRTIASACSRVSPWLTQPGSAGTATL